MLHTEQRRLALLTLVDDTAVATGHSGNSSFARIILTSESIVTPVSYTHLFCFPRHRNVKPCVFQIGIKIQQIRSLGKEQELMLRIFTDQMCIRDRYLCFRLTLTA